jgi:DNA-binding transcriptional LysR family regulator
VSSRAGDASPRKLLAGLHDAAPRSEIEIVPLDERAPDDLAAGRVDVVIGNLPALGAVTRHELLFRERYVCLLSDAHPDIGESLSMDQFAAASHVVMASPTPGNQLMDAALAEHHLRRRTAIRTPHFAELAQLVKRGPLIAVLPSRLAAIHMAGGGLRVLPLPLAVPEFDVRLYWHVRNAGSKAQLWLRETLLELLRAE